MAQCNHQHLQLNSKTAINLAIILNMCILLLGCNQDGGAPKGEQDLSSPNIIFILADDLGYADVGYFAHDITGEDVDKQYYETPNINKMALQGTSFAQAYANPLCSPSRASLLTGKIAAKMGFTTATGTRGNTHYAKGTSQNEGTHPLDWISSGNSAKNSSLVSASTQTALASGSSLDNGVDEITFAEVLTNYRSSFIGKWHVGAHGVDGYQPSDQGFEELAYFDAGGSPYFNWRTLWQHESKNKLENSGKPMRRGGVGKDTGEHFLTRELTQQALNYLDDRANDNEPFLLYFSHFAVHGPIQAESKDIEYFSQKSTKGWKGQYNATYAAMVKSLDESVGSIMDKLEEIGLDDNTYVIFMSDNGGVDYLIDQKGEHQKGTPANPIPTSNSPLTGGKATVYEGGVRVPLIIWKKNSIEKGGKVKVVVDTSDIFPTILAMAGQNVSAYVESVTNTANSIDGQSLLPLLTDVENAQKTYTKDTVYWHYPFNVRVNNPKDVLPSTPHSAMRKGKYKFILDWYGRLSLYDIELDPYESNNLFESEPEQVSLMCNQLLSWLDSNVKEHYFSKENPDYESWKEDREVAYQRVRDLELCKN